MRTRRSLRAFSSPRPISSPRRKPGSRLSTFFKEKFKNWIPAFAGMTIFGLTIVSSQISYAEFFVGEGATGFTFLKVPISARATALGGSFAAVNKDATSIEYNPAGLSGIDRTHMHASFLKYFEDSDFQAFTVALPITLFQPKPYEESYAMGPESNKLLLGVHYRGFNAEDTARNSIGVELEDFNIRDQLFQLSFAYSPWERLSLGLSGKVINSKLDDKKAQAFAADAGVQIQATEQLRFGAALTNLGSSEAFIKEKDPLPTAIRMGATYDLNSLKLLGDVVYGRDEIPQESIGAEWDVNQFFESEIQQFSLKLRGGVAFHTDPEIFGGFGLLFQPPQEKSWIDLDNDISTRRRNDLEDVPETPNRSTRNSSTFTNDPLVIGLDFAVRSQVEFGLAYLVSLSLFY